MTVSTLRHVVNFIDEVPGHWLEHFVSFLPVIVFNVLRTSENRHEYVAVPLKLPNIARRVPPFDIASLGSRPLKLSPAHSS